MSKTIIKLADAPRRLRLKKMQIAGFLAHASAKRRILVGFYRDESGKIRPVTKSAVEVRRKKVVKHGKQFKGVKPRFSVVKGIRMSVKEYRAFVDYLNDFRIQKFTKRDVEEWLRFHEETDSHLKISKLPAKKSKRVFTVSWYENKRWFESKVRAVNQKEARTKIKLNHPTARAVRVATLKRRFGNEYRH